MRQNTQQFTIYIRLTINSVSSSSLYIIGFGIRDLSENERMGLSLIMTSTK